MPGGHPVQVREVETEKESHAYRSPLKFGGVVTTHATLLSVRLRVEAPGGRTAWGSGSMPLGNVWSFPSKKVPPDLTLCALETLAEKIAASLPDLGDRAHPIELAHRWESEWLDLAAQTTRELALAEPIPRLATLVCASPFDAALHDAYGRLHGRHVYECYGADWVGEDLSRYLDERFQEKSLDAYVLRRPRPRLPLYHLVGALDTLDPDDVKEHIRDGLPNTLGEWIERDQLTHLKIKLNGSEAAWDIGRILGVERVVVETQARRNVKRWVYSLDFNEQCPHVEYLLEVLRKVKEASAAAFDRVAYVEQPTARDLRAHLEIKMHRAAALKPVVIDESLEDYESLLLAREQGYSGVALKACKGQSQSLLLAAAAQEFGMFLCVQDLTCPGQSFLHSASLAAHIAPVTAVEGNARQYCPAANAVWAARFPGVFTVRDGQIETGGLVGPGLGY